jgi:hypothetical protein
MKIIITENQMDKFIQKLRMGIEKHGFNDTAKMTGFNKLKLAELSGLPIKGDTFHSENEIVVGDLLRDLVNQNKEYKNCTLHYSGLEGVVLWDCNFMDEENYYRLNVYATPYWDGQNSTPIDIFDIEVTPINSPDDKKEFDTSGNFGEIDSPELFENVTELVDWFEETYLPKTYDIIVKSLEDFKEREL